MQFPNEVAVEIEIDGKIVFDIADADGAPVGLFLSRAAALGAQREVNIKKLLLKKPPVEDDVHGYGCEVVFDDGSCESLFATFANAEWLLEDCPFDEVLNVTHLPKPI